MQLVGNGVTMYDTMKDNRIGAAEVMEKFGVGPDKVIEVQALIGDFTDNVPGVPGIGVKTAAQLIGEYGDLETLLKRGERDQAGQAPAVADRQCRDRAYFQTPGHARPERTARRAGGSARGARAGLQKPDRLPQGDGVHHHHAPRCGKGRDRRLADRSGYQADLARAHKSRAKRAGLCGRRPVCAAAASQAEAAKAEPTAPSLRSRSPPRAPRPRATRKSTAADTNACAPSTD